MNSGDVLQETRNGNKYTVEFAYIPSLAYLLTVAGKYVIYKEADHTLNAKAFIDRYMPFVRRLPVFHTFQFSLNYSFRERYGVTLIGAHNRGVSNQVTAAGKVGIVHTEGHKLNAHAFITKDFQSLQNPSARRLYGGSLSYSFNKRIGGSLGIAKTDGVYPRRTDYWALGILNIVNSPTISVDLSAGFTKFGSSSIRTGRWQPSGGVSFSRNF